MIDHNVTILKHTDMIPIIDYISEKYGNAYLKTFKEK